MNKTNALILAALSVIIPSAVGGSQYAYENWVQGKTGKAGKVSVVQLPSLITMAHAEVEWIASAPGRVEPVGGEVKIAAGSTGRVIAVPVAINKKVSAGDVLVQLEDDGATARLQSAKVEAQNRKKDRDDDGGGDGDFRTKEDAVATAELDFWNIRDALDRAVERARKGSAAGTEVEDARKAYIDAERDLADKRDALAQLQQTKKPPNPKRTETALAAARAERAQAAAVLEKTKIRAPADGTILQLEAKVGELVTPSPEQVLVVLGDMSALRIRAEMEERDVGKVKVSQPAIVRADAFTGQDFNGKVTQIAPALTAPKLGSRGPNKRTDVDILEVFVELDPNTPLVPGMRVDVFFKEAAVGNTPLAEQPPTPPTPPVAPSN
jgi:HlyD family secretion protein